MKDEAHGEICETDPCSTCDAIGSGLAAVGQSLINISEGLIEIEAGSLLFNGMSKLMDPKIADLLRAAPDLVAALKTSAIVIHQVAHPRYKKTLFAECVDLVCTANRAALIKAGVL